MGQWEEKLGAILNDPQAMSQIMSIAQSLGGGPGQPSQDVQEPAEPAAEAPTEPLQDTQEAMADTGPELDPRVMAAGLRALSVWQDPEDGRAALLQALRPFVKEERQSKVDRAIRIVRLSKAVRAALDGLQGGVRADV